MNPESNLEHNATPNIFITYSPTIDSERGVYDADTIAIPVLDEDWPDHRGAGVPMVAIEKGRHEFEGWIEQLVRSKCADLLADGRMYIESAAMPTPKPIVENSVVQGTPFEPVILTVFSPYVGTPFEFLQTPVSALGTLAHIPEELRMQAIEVAASEIEGDELLQRLKVWLKNPFLKPGVKTRLTKMARRLEEVA